MDDDLLEILEQLKGRTITDVVTGDMEDANSLCQFAVLKLDNNKQVTISSLAFKQEGDKLVSNEEGLTGLTAVYGDLEEFWDEIETDKDSD
ncbi:MAG TPA: hypothetical protein VNU93_00185 [Verrucomicrobiae bacterium]|nr:hypothetical protein [Verrucomicrobiae bacterium]